MIAANFFLKRGSKELHDLKKIIKINKIEKIEIFLQPFEKFHLQQEMVKTEHFTFAVSLSNFIKFAQNYFSLTFEEIF